MTTPRILVTGGLGFVARSLTRHLLARHQWVLSCPKEMLNIGDESEVRAALAKYKIDVLLNAAGTKDLQGCEDDPERAMRLNAYAPAMVARVCAEVGVKFVHVGSDHAYAVPMTAYGESKRRGDAMVMEANPAALVVVTGHVYDVDCPWVIWLRKELEAGRRVEAWTDVWNWPTYARNLADIVLELIEDDAAGIVGCTGLNPANRYILFRTYAHAMGLDMDLVVPCPTLCPSRLHPRGITLPNTFRGVVRPMTLLDGMRAMTGWVRPVTKEVLTEGVAA